MVNKLPFQKRIFKALLIGRFLELTAAPIPLLKRAGFEIDLICPGYLDFDTQSISLIASIGDSLVQTAAHQVQTQNYDVVILGGDDCIAEILDSDLADEIKLKLLPVKSTKNFTHLYSKCGLSKALQDSMVPTPAFAICDQSDVLLNAAHHIGFPLFIKVDRSGGGDDVYECQSADDVVKKAVSCLIHSCCKRKLQARLLISLRFIKMENWCLFLTPSFINRFAANLARRQCEGIRKSALYQCKSIKN